MKDPRIIRGGTERHPLEIKVRWRDLLRSHYWNARERLACRLAGVDYNQRDCRYCYFGKVSDE